MRRSACRLRVALIGARPTHRRAFARWLIEIVEGCSVEELGHVANLGVATTAAEMAAFDLACFVIEAGFPETGVNFLDGVTACAPNVPVVALSNHAGNALLAEAIGRGARGYILTSMQTAVARAAIKLILAGGVFVPATMLINAPYDQVEGAQSTKPDASKSISPLAAQHHAFAGDKPEAREHGSTASRFTKREAEIMAALQTGKPNKIIASELGIRESTVKVHVARLMRKLNATSRTQVVSLSRRPAPKRK